VYLKYIGKFDVPELRTPEEIEAELIRLEPIECGGASVFVRYIFVGSCVSGSSPSVSAMVRRIFKCATTYGVI
jgi:hypothetical protein